MIIFKNVTKIYKSKSFENIVFKDLNFTLKRGQSLAICGANGAGKSTLTRLIAGVEKPTSGTITRKMSTSWPIGYTSAFQSSLTGADNCRFIARVYGKPEAELLAYVEDFAQLGLFFRQPIKTYSAGMVARLAFGVSLAINFDCYLVDEVTGAGDERFRTRCHEALLERRQKGTLIMISHDFNTLKEYCDLGAVMYQKQLHLFDTVDEAITFHQEKQKQ
ncbi:MAG: ABC transporter ATP-binding protein [Zymomonas mobilis subsp. pomaceae]|uniref:ABC transporter ATP-binding protein n=1 Tax=Zymomonas mobilis TaxID=542 RepID=UPI0039EB7997